MQVLWYAKVQTEVRVNTTDPAVFNARWRLFWAYLYLIIPSIRSIFAISQFICRAKIYLETNGDRETKRSRFS